MWEKQEQEQSQQQKGGLQQAIEEQSNEMRNGRRLQQRADMDWVTGRQLGEASNQ